MEKAEGHFQAAVRLDPHDPDCYFEHGLLMAGKEDYSDAEVAFRKVLEINPLYPEGHTHLGYMLEAQGKPDEAVAEYEKATTDFPDDARAQFALGRMAVNQGRYAEGIRLLLISVRTGKDSGVHLGLLKVDGGITANELCMQIQADVMGVEVSKPEVAETTALGAAYARAGDRENALQYLRRAGEGAEAHGQTKLKQEIDADLKELETEPGAP